jgi:hypothetical protein
MIGGCSMLSSFFGYSHGKGLHDGVGTIIKCFIWQEQLNAYGCKLQNVEEVVAFLWEKLSCKPKTSYSRERTLMHRVFWHV